MSLTAADVAEIMRLVESSSFQEISLELNGVKLSLRRGGASGDAAPPPLAALTPVAAPASALPQPPAIATKAPRSAEEASLHEVTAPLLGTFYCAPKPGAPPFVEVGSVVEPDTVVGIIEVMKVMNSVRAGVHGRVVEICSADGALVEFGETILLVKPV